MNPKNLSRLNKLNVIRLANENIPKKIFFKFDKLDFDKKEIVNDKNKIIPIYGLTKANKIDEINKMLNLDLIFISEYIIKLIQVKVIGSFPIEVIQRLRVGKNITNSDKNFIGPLIFLVNVFIFDAKAKVPIFPIKENKNVMEKILK